MKKNILLLLAFITILSLKAQKKELLFRPEGERVIKDVNFSSNGDVYFITGKNVLSDKKSEKKLFKYNKNLEKVLEINMKLLKRGYGLPSIRISENGNYFLYGSKWLIDEKGRIKDFDFKKEETGNVNPALKFISNTQQVFIGPSLGRKNYKKKYSAGDINIFARSLADFTTTENTLQTAPIRSNLEEGETISWSLGESFDTYFNMLTKDKMDVERIVDTYHVVSYNYDGTIKSYVPLTVKLDTGHFMLSTNGGPAVFNDANYGSFASAAIKTDKSTGDMYTYGFYTDRAKKKMIMGKYKGFYVYKFSPKGKVLWKQSINFEKYDLFKKTFNGAQVYISYNKISDSEILMKLSSREDDYLIFKLNSNNGKVTFEQNVTDFKYKIKKYRQSYMNKDDFPKKYFSYSAVAAMYLNKDIYNYVSSFDEKTKIYIDAKFLEDGSIILDHYKIKASSKISYKDEPYKIVKF